MSLDSVVNLSISKVTKAPTRQGFGTPLIVAYHTVTAKRMALYTSVKAITDDGFPVSHPVVRIATKIFSQNPAPTQVMVGKRLLAPTQVVLINPITTTQGFHYQFQVVDYLGVVTSIDYTVPNAATVASISTALVALLGSVAHVTAATVGGPVTGFTLTSSTPGDLFNLTGLPNPDDMSVKNNTTDPGIATDLAQLNAIDSLTWYGLILDSSGKAESVAAAAWVEATRKIMGITSSDSEICNNAVTNDVFSTLKTASYARTFGFYSATELLSYTAAAMMGNRFPTNPGAATWKFVTLEGVTIDALEDAQVTNIENKNGNVYVNLAGQGSTEQGLTFAGEFIDITVGTDWLHARMQERIIGALQNASNAGSKIPYTDQGVSIIVGLIYAQLKEAQSPAFNLLALNPKPVVSAPAVADVDLGNRATRNLPNITFKANYAGAIHAVQIFGTITV